MGETTTLAVHRCRFVDYTPSAITALAFPPLPLPSSAKGKQSTSIRKSLKFGTLAVGHANGNIDLCDWAGGERDLQSSQAWVLQKTLPGPYPSKVDSITFVIRYPDDLNDDDVPSCSDLRLFSSGGGSELLEWDMDRACVRRTIGSQGGSIWCMAANPASTLLALGCEDGTVRLLSLTSDTLTHYRRFDRVKCRVLSIAWGPPVPPSPKKRAANAVEGSDDEDDEEVWDDVWLATGGSDSSIRKWDVSTGRVIDRMGTDKVRGERTLVWTVGVLGDGTIVSGDSLGIVKFWDSRTCTQLQSFQGHGADVLCLTVSPDGSTVFTSGVDQKTCQFSLVKTGSGNQSSNSLSRSSGRWVQTCSRRMHSHDVRALAVWPPYTTLPPSHRRQFPMDVAPILASGGLDMSVVVTPAALPSTTVVKVINPLSTSVDCTFEDSYHRRLAYSTGSSLQVARKARLISCMRDSGVSVWRILERPSSDEDGFAELQNPSQDSNHAAWEKLLEMDLNVHTNLVASGISDDGRWLVVSDLYETKLFSLDLDTQGHLKPHRIRDFSSILQTHVSGHTGGLAFQFTPDSTKLVMSTAMSSFILVIDLSGEKPRVLRRFDHHRLRDSIVRNRVVKGRKTDDDAEMAGVTAEVEESEDEIEGGSTPVLVSVHRISISPDGQWLATSDDRARTHIFNLDSIKHHSVLPSFSSPVQVLSFDPTRPSVLIMGFPDNSLQIYNVESRQFPTWGKELCNNLPKRFRLAHDPVLGVTFDPAHHFTNGAPRYALFWGSTWICKLSFNEAAVSGMNRKRRRESVKLAPPVAWGDESSPVDFKMITHYRPILHVDFLERGELLVVERPLVDVLSGLPPAYFKHKYGAS
ncbi:U3 small nucleolar RNA-associated protein 4 [Hypsizygus marmoreus]|uniref:U3 small nucleolar RNA-associated protein 4 n=1 Tax=Hypsizygus marmoreus TaxID=39966 RepID=A0A369KD58_HYPMA|nr:U3 small nucleolar RNA-associated protein 4 [Hypsizygus marmoreus]